MINISLDLKYEIKKTYTYMYIFPFMLILGHIKCQLSITNVDGVYIKYT